MKGDRVRGGSGSVDVGRLENGVWTFGTSGAVARLGVYGRDGSTSKVSYFVIVVASLETLSLEGLSSTSTLGGVMATGGSEIRGTMALLVLWPM